MGAKDFFFFVDADKQAPSVVNYLKAQAAGDPLYGPVTSGATAGMDEFRVTSLHSATFNPTAYAMCDATVCVQAIPNTTPGLVNIVLRPLVQPALNFAPVKYIIYKGILASSLIAANGLDVAAASTNELTQLAWDVQTRKNASAGTSATAPAAALGVGLTGTNFADTDPIDNLFYRAGVSFQLLNVNGGWSLGQFDKTQFGIEVLMEGLNFRHTLKLARQMESRISVATQATTATDAQKFDHWHAKEQILGFMDPCAFYGSFFKAGIQAKKSGNVPFAPKAGNDLYTDALFPFYGRSQVYLDIRNEHNFSFNYFKTYGTTLKLGNASAAVDYYGQKWPILVLTAANFAAGNATKPYNRIALRLPVGDNPNPLVYVSQGYRDINIEKDGFPAELSGAEQFFAAFAAPASGYTTDNSASGAESLTFAVANVTGLSATTPIASYIRLKYLKQQQGVTTVPTAISAANYLDNLIWPLDLKFLFEVSPGLGINSAVYDEEVYVNAQHEAGLKFDFIGKVGIARDADNTTLFILPTNIRTQAGSAADLVALTGETNAYTGHYPNFIALKYPQEWVIKKDLSLPPVATPTLVPVADFVAAAAQSKFTVPDFGKLIVIVVANAAFDLWKARATPGGPAANRFRTFLGIKNLQAQNDTAGMRYTSFELVLRDLAPDTSTNGYKIVETGTAQSGSSANVKVYAHVGA